MTDRSTQFEDAAAEVARLMTKAAASPQTGYGRVTPALRLVGLEVLTRWSAGGSTCRHNPRMDRPTPVAAAAWQRDLIVCLHCMDLLSPPKSEKFRCDICGRTDKRLRNAAVGFGPLALHWGECFSCRGRWAA